MTDDLDPIIVAGDEGMILADGDGEVRCPNGHEFDCDRGGCRCRESTLGPNGHEFDRDDALTATFDGTTARYQCPACGERTEGSPPG